MDSDKDTLKDRRGAIAGGVLVGLLLFGLGIRVVAAAAWWPMVTTAGAGDASTYALYAGEANPFANPQHPAGYPLFLSLIGVVTRSVAVLGVVQQLLGLASAVVLFAAVRRMCGSPWPGVVGAAVILLGADQIHLERAVMAETLFVFLLAAAMYAIARALEGARWWPVVAAVLVVAAGVTRSAGLFAIPVVLLGLLLVALATGWSVRWRPVVAFSVTASALLLGYAGVNAASTGRFEVAPAGGWHLYGRIAPFADCERFVPPAGTRRLCEASLPDHRPGTDWYLYHPEAPAWRVFGSHPSEHDSELGAFARAAMLAQPKAYVEAVWNDLSAYFAPASFDGALGKGDVLDWAVVKGAHLDGSVDWEGPAYPEIVESMSGRFFDDFSVERDPGLTALLHDYQRVFRFGATALTIALLLILGALVAGRRNRIPVLVLGVGGLAMFVLPTLSVVYIARYTIPIAPFIAAGAAVATMSLVDFHRTARWRRPAT
jgi:hypothetical protein